MLVFATPVYYLAMTVPLKLVSYMNYKDEGMIIGKGCGTVGMIPEHFYREAYELGKKIK